MAFSNMRERLFWLKTMTLHLQEERGANGQDLTTPSHNILLLKKQKHFCCCSWWRSRFCCFPSSSSSVRTEYCLCRNIMMCSGVCVSVSLLARLLLLLETEAGPAAQFPLLLGEVVSSRGAGPRFQNVVHLETRQSHNLSSTFTCSQSFYVFILKPTSPGNH